MGQYCFARWHLSASVTLLADGPAAWAVGWPTLQGGPVVLRPVRATPCLITEECVIHFCIVSYCAVFTEQAYQVQRGVTKVTKTLDSSISVTSSTSTTTTKRVNQGTPSTTARPAILMRWNKLAINKPLIPTNRQLAVASKHGAASSKTMRSDTHNSASTISSHVVIMSAVLTGLAHLLN